MKGAGRKNAYSRKCRMLLVFLSVLALLNHTINAQDIKVNGGFLSDSLKIGEQTAYYLSAHYKSEHNILFPDSTYTFSPFEYQQRKYFPTETKDGVSFDSAVYYLTTFEVTRVQFLELPVYVVQPQDCTVFKSSLDSIRIIQLVAKVPDSLSVDKLPLKMNTAYQKVFFEFNIWVVLIGLLLLLIIGVIVWIFFGKKIVKYMKARRLKRNHHKFLERYDSILRQLNSTFSSITTESALSTWKKYMEQLETLPYTKLTTKETLSLVHDEALARNLSMLDRSIYGHDTSVIEPLENLKGYADKRFTKKLEELRHGR